uniref:Uncharacterized protein n=1 Tax=Daphnia magna TaxID=35525 RepID=A0A0P6GNJ9_9CRUS
MRHTHNHFNCVLLRNYIINGETNMFSEICIQFRLYRIIFSEFQEM